MYIKVRTRPVMVKFWYAQGKNIEWIMNRYNLTRIKTFEILGIDVLIREYENVNEKQNNLQFN